MSVQVIYDRSDLRKYRTELPNIYDDADLGVYEFRLLVHYKRVGTCTESTATTARKCKISTGKVSAARKVLAAGGWITLTEVATPKGMSYSIEVVDRWQENFNTFAPAQRSPDEHQPSPHEEVPSPGETKKELKDKNKSRGVKPAPSQPDNLTVGIQIEYENLLGRKLEGREWSSGEGAAAKQIAQKFTPAQLRAAYQHYKGQAFWGDKRLTLRYMEKNMTDLLTGKGAAASKPRQFLPEGI